jgi:hypothetical protein
VGFPVLRKGLMHLRIGFDARRLEAGLDHPQTAERKDRPLERFVGLQSDDHFVVAVDISCLVRQHRRRRFCINGKYASLPFVLEEGLELGPDCLGALRRPRQEFLVTVVGRDVANYKIADIDGVAPIPRLEVSPAALVRRAVRKCGGFHGISPSARFICWLCVGASAINVIKPFLRLLPSPSVRSQQRRGMVREPPT